jgi:hypothetical protein
MAKILCVLYDDRIDGYPNSYPRDGLPKLEQHAPSRHDTTYVGLDAFRTDPLRRGYERNSGVLVRRSSMREEYPIVDGGHLAGAGAHSYSPGNAAKGSDEAARFRD